MRGGHEMQHPGIIPLALRDIFQELSANHGHPFKPHHAVHGSGSGSGGFGHHLRESVNPKLTKLKTWIVKVSYLEIYNECVNDLLNPLLKNLSIRENKEGRAIIDNLTEYEV